MPDFVQLLNNKYFLWIGFNVLVIGMLALDMGVFHKRDHEISIKESIVWSIIWILVALAFNLGVYFWHGPQVALQFFTGYLIERSLSMDNIFVFLLIFEYFRVPAKYQYRVLIWGIVGALVFRGLFIAMGTLLVAEFHWVIYVFGAFLVVTGVRMAFGEEKKVAPEKNPLLRVVRHFLPVTSDFSGKHFFVHEGGRWLATPLLIVLIVVESTDIVFAVDSIPAIFAITLDPFIVYTSNVFAILGLRALYFALAGLMKMFYYLKYALSFILAFVGVKMLISSVYRMPDVLALGVLASALAISIVASILFHPDRKKARQE